MITERVRALLHRVMAARISVTAQTALTTLPQPVQLLEATPAETAVRAGQTAAIGTRVVEVDARVAVVLDVVGDVLAGRLRAGGFVQGGGGTVVVV